MPKISSFAKQPPSGKQTTTYLGNRATTNYEQDKPVEVGSTREAFPGSNVQPTTSRSFFWPEILAVLPPALSKIILSLPAITLENLEEIRLRQGKPLLLSLPGGDCMLDREGIPTKRRSLAYLVTEDDLQRVIQLVSDCSWYAFEEELRNGYITLPGGHRVGLTGKPVVEKGKIKTLKYISGLNIRISREILNTANFVLPYLLDHKSGNIYHTLIFSPPRCGKTTLLRDLIRQISDGIPRLNFSGVTVGLVDERSELAGCHLGIPQHDIGLRTDVLDGCPKAQGAVMLLRSMAPQVIATDEIGSREDVAALEEIFNAGVKVIVTVHGSSLSELAVRPTLNYLLSLKVIERYVLLGRSKGVGTIEEIIDGKTMQTIWKNS